MLVRVQPRQPSRRSRAACVAFVHGCFRARSGRVREWAYRTVSETVECEFESHRAYQIVTAGTAGRSASQEVIDHRAVAQAQTPVRRANANQSHGVYRSRVEVSGTRESSSVGKSNGILIRRSRVRFPPFHSPGRTSGKSDGQ